MATYDLTRFRASHNSYSGGKRGSLEKQLNAKVRCVEFDFHDNDFTTFKDYRIGHLKPGAEVDLKAPNPGDSLLGSWLGAVAAWSSAHPGHEPLTIILDAKDDLTDNTDGDLEDLNRRLEGVFGQRLFTREEFDRYGAWPEMSVLRDRVVCVLSGNGASRAAYRWTFGTTPAVGVNANADVVLAYRSTSGELNYWSGSAKEGAGAVTWLRKNTLAVTDVDLAEPAIRINDDGWVVAVYRFGPRPQVHGLLLESRLGRLQDDGRVIWFKTQILSAGKAPSLKVDDDEVELIHRTEDGAKLQLVTGVIDRSKRRVNWKKPKNTQRAPSPGDVAVWTNHTVRVAPDGLGAIGCAIDGGVSLPVRFRQVGFVERQKGEDPKVFRDAPFFGAGAANRLDIAEARNGGLVARAWGFGELDKTDPSSPPQENFPATDTPHEAWYRTYVD